MPVVKHFEEIDEFHSDMLDRFLSELFLICLYQTLRVVKSLNLSFETRFIK